MTTYYYTATLKPASPLYGETSSPYKVHVTAPGLPREDTEVIDTYDRTDGEGPNLDKVATSLERQGWEITGQWIQVGETTWEVMVNDRRTETVMEGA